jgi:transcriptional regulator with XRE-family HTH domain
MVRPAATVSRLKVGWVSTAPGDGRTCDQCAALSDGRVRVWQTAAMAGNPGAHFGKELRQERLAHGWGLDELAKVTAISVGHLSRIETGKRPPTGQVAIACDKAFPARRGWFLRFYEDLQTWAETPSWFKPFGEHEMTTETIRSWSPSVLNGLLQTEEYARAQIGLFPDISPEQVTERVASRLARQNRVLFRDNPPKAHFLVDITSLQRMPARLKAGQLRHLLEVAALPHVVTQVVPVCWHAGMSGGFIMTDSAAYAEEVHTGQVYGNGDETVRSLAQRFDSIKYEAMRVSESQALIREMLERDRLAKVKLLKRQRR